MLSAPEPLVPWADRKNRERFASIRLRPACWKPRKRRSAPSGSTNPDLYHGLNPFGETRRKRRTFGSLRIDCIPCHSIAAWGHAGSWILSYLAGGAPPARGHAA